MRDRCLRCLYRFSSILQLRAFRDLGNTLNEVQFNDGLGETVREIWTIYGKLEEF